MHSNLVTKQAVQCMSLVNVEQPNAKDSSGVDHDIMQGIPSTTQDLFLWLSIMDIVHFLDTHGLYIDVVGIAHRVG